MKRFTLIFALLALAAGFGGHQAPAAVSFGAPAELAAIDYPEPRVFLDNQGWWLDGHLTTADPDPVAMAFESVHSHGGANYPLGERVVLNCADPQPYAWDYVAQAHENVGGSVRGFRGGGFLGVGDGGGLTYDAQMPHVKFDDPNWRFAGALEHEATDVASWCKAAPGVYENRFTFDITSKYGKRQYMSGAWNAFLNAPGQPVGYTSRGWYEGPGYTNVTMKAKAQAHTLANGTWYAPGKLVPYSLAQGANWAFAYIDADIHHGSKGLVVMEMRKGTSGSFALPALEPGDHTLLLGGVERAAAGWNAGVMRIPFHVN
jgi:hypothetical protein